jgi:hypothetical protein
LPVWFSLPNSHDSLFFAFFLPLFLIFIAFCLLLLRRRYTIDEQRGTLTISNVMRTDAGDIKCLVENQAGKIDKAASLSVRFDPTFTSK